MDRRAFCRRIACLSVVGASGCLAEDSNPASANAADDADATDDSEPVPKPDDARRRVELTDVDEVPGDVPLSATLEVRYPWITTNETTALALSMTNAGSERREHSPLYYKGASSHRGEPGLLVVTAYEKHEPRTAVTPDCWENSEPRVDSPSFTTEEPPSHDLAPGETVVTNLVVADDPSVEGCFPPGTYRFERPNLVDGTEFRWSFTIEVRDVSDDS